MIKLTARDRLSISQFLPKTATLEEAIVASDLKDKFEFTQAELEKFEVKTTLTNDKVYLTTWNKAGNEEVEFELTRLEIKLLKEGLARLDKEKAVGTDKNFLILCKKIQK